LATNDEVVELRLHSLPLSNPVAAAEAMVLNVANFSNSQCR